MKLSKLINPFLLLFLGLTLLLAACGESVPVQPSAPNSSQPSPTATVAPTISIAAVTSVPATTAPVPTTAVATTEVGTTAAPTTTVAATTAAPTTAAPATTQAVRTTTAAPTFAPQSIRQTKWQEVIKADPQLSKDETPVPGNAPGPYVTVRNGEAGGFPLYENIVYVDMDGDGIEEAAILLQSGGTAGATGVLVYKQASPSPRLTDSAGGYKLSLQTEPGRLVITNALYGAGEPNCCPGGIAYTSYNLTNGKLTKVSERSEGYPDAQPRTVEQFYSFVNEKKYDEAYKMLAPAFRTANPYQNWVVGFATTKSVEAKASLEPGAANTVRVEITSNDSTPNGGQVIKRFSGTWKLTWDGKLPGWVLGSPAISEIAPAAQPVVHPAFRGLTANLKARTPVAVLLPGVIEGGEPGLTIYAAIERADAVGYTVDFAFAPDCNGAGACRLGSFAGETVSPQARGLSGTRVALSNGLTGFFTDFSCGANCEDATLSWQQNNVRYTVALKAGKQAALVKMANSAISNGRV